MNNILIEATDYVRDVCQQYHVDETHGLSHALAVVNHIQIAIKNDTLFHLDSITKQDLLLTGLLHDIDDHKYYPIDTNNALNFLSKKLDMNRSQKILKWISYIPTSQNGNQIPIEAIAQPWVLWPRYCDRIEAVGITGISRVIKYSRLRGVPDFVDSTPRPSTSDEVCQFATPDRFEKYVMNNGVSASCIDHIYDKLLHICDVQTHSPYITHCLSNGKQYLIDICLQYGHSGRIKKI